MKIVGVDNYANESVADLLVAENISNRSFADVMCKALNDKYCIGEGAPRFYQVMEDNYILSRGMEDLV